MEEILKRWCPKIIHSAYANSKFWIRFHFFRKGLVSEMFRGLLGYEMDWKNPQDLNQKINWMKLNYDTTEWPRLADKYLVRQYIRERIGDDVLPKVYGVWKKAEDIDLNSLPQKFVLKTNHGCGMVIPVINKTKMDFHQTCAILNKWVNQKFGYDTIEPHYLKIKPLIYAEEYLENDVDFSSALVDYKVFCLSGNPHCILVCLNRENGKHTDLYFFDCDWNEIPTHIAGSHKEKGVVIPRPTCLYRLLEYAAALAKGHPQVRIDFYIIKGKVYFGEMTFTSQGGFMDYLSREFSLEMGRKVSLH